jgi:hypothetical protein
MPKADFTGRVDPKEPRACGAMRRASKGMIYVRAIARGDVRGKSAQGTRLYRQGKIGAALTLSARSNI